MWGRVSNRESYLAVAIEFTGNAKLYGEHMLRVTREWKYSCEHNLTALDQNRQAWIGHAACALAFMCPEDIVREAWGHLKEQQQIEANNVADIAIRDWEERCQNVNSESTYLPPRVKESNMSSMSSIKYMSHSAPEKTQQLCFTWL